MIIEWFNEFNTNSTNLFENGFYEFVVNTLTILIATLVVWYLFKRFFMRYTQKKELDIVRVEFIVRTLRSILFSLTGFAIAAQIIPLNNLAISLLASSGVLVIVIGFAAQETVSNLISGFFISFFRPFSINDLIVLVDKNITGIVEDITMRHTIIRTFENNRVVIPNSIINKSIIENRDLKDHKACRFLVMSIAYHADLDKARAIMIEEATNHPLLIDNRSKKDIKDGVPWFKVILSQLSSSSVDLRITLWTKTSGDAFVALADLRESIKKRFDAEGIEIPYPTQNIHIKK
jgi:small conductance mechanosensitive channel